MFNGKRMDDYGREIYVPKDYILIQFLKMQKSKDPKYVENCEWTLYIKRDLSKKNGLI